MGQVCANHQPPKTIVGSGLDKIVGDRKSEVKAQVLYNF